MLRKCLPVLASYLFLAFAPNACFSADVNTAQLSMPAKMRLDVSPWQLSPSGGWRAIAKIQYLDNENNPVNVKTYKSGFEASGAEQRTLADWVFHTRAALILTNKSSSVKVRAWSSVPKMNAAIKWLQPPADDLAHFSAVAQEVGPYAIGLAWTPLAKSIGVKSYEIWRIEGGKSTLIASVPAKQTNYFDAKNIQANQNYQYQVKAMSLGELKTVKSNEVKTMPALPQESIKNFYGKGVFLSFSPKEDAKNSYLKFPVDTIIAQAKKSRLNFIELQMQYGEYPRISDPGVNKWYQELLEQAHANGLKIIAWVTPCNPTIETLHNTVQFLDDRSSRGDSIDGVALDIEPGDSFMGDNATFPAKAIKYISELKAAVGSYPLTVIVNPPHVLTTYPYAQMANYVDLVAPMIFWHHHLESRRFHYNQNFVANYCSEKFALVRAKLGKSLPMLMVAQSADLGNTGVPSANEINWALQTAKKAGAVGVSFFDWAGMHQGIWGALSNYDFS